MPSGIHTENVTEWLLDRIPNAAAPFTFELIAGGHSNLTFTVTDTADKKWVLRRPPLFQVLATAHDMEREHRIISALDQSDVPVPTVVGICTDEAVNERPFYVMDFVEGAIIRTGEIAALTTPEFRVHASRSLMDVLGRIHRVDVEAVGLGELGRKEDYIGRQLRRWMRQFEASKVDDRPAFAEVHDFLASNVPTQGPAAIVHGDYRLDNCMMGPDGSVAAVLDWELCTLGDPLADVSGLLTYWTEPGDTSPALNDPPTAAGGFLSRQELLDIYQESSGRSVKDIEYYLAFSAWRLASILEGVYSRYVNGAMGDNEASRDADEFVTQINNLLERSAAHASAA